MSLPPLHYEPPWRSPPVVPAPPPHPPPFARLTKGTPTQELIWTHAMRDPPPYADPMAGSRARRNLTIAALLTVGVALRVWQYAADMSMWFDELSIARNLHERSFATLMLHPLGYDQVAPIGFLAVLEASAAVLGPSDLALRIFPFLCGIAALFLFYRLADRMLAPGAALIVLALFALGPAFIRYTGELKQYGVDVLATIILTLVALDLHERTPTVRRCVVAGCIGAVLVWFSQAALLVMAGLAGALVIRWLGHRDPETSRPLRITVPIWAATSIVALVVSRYHVTPETLAFMHAFWGGRGGFLPRPFSPVGTVLWFWRQIVDLFGIMMGYPWPAVYAALTLAGFVILWRQRRYVALLLLGPLAATLLATGANQYPFRTRVVVFIIPSLVLAAAATIDWLRLQASRVLRVFGSAVTAALLAIPAAALWITPPPYYTEAFKPVLAYVHAHHQRGDAVYVFSNAYEALDRYGAHYGIPVGTDVIGICDERQVRPYLQNVDRFRGVRRLWVIGASVPEFRPPRQTIGRYLQTIGVRRDSIGFPSRAPIDPVTAELFDLSNTARLRTATAATFPVPPVGDRHPVCHDWVRPTRASVAR